MRNDVLQSLGGVDDDELGDLVPAPIPAITATTVPAITPTPTGLGLAIVQVLGSSYIAKQQGKTERAYIKAGVVAPGSVLAPQAQAQGGSVLPAGDSNAGAPEQPGNDFWSRHGGTVLAVAVTIVVTAFLLKGNSAR